MSDEKMFNRRNPLQIDEKDDSDVCENAMRYGIPASELRTVIERVGRWKNNIEADLRMHGKLP